MLQRVVKGLVCGAVGGVVGTLAMQQYWTLVQKITGEDPRARTRQKNGKLDEINVVEMQAADDESSTEAAGRVLYEAAMDEQPWEKEKEVLSETVHWGYGAAQGALYGAVSAVSKRPAVMPGSAWGGAMWLLGDELAVPLLGLSKGPTRYPVSQHVHRALAHLVYGSAMAATTRFLCRI